MKNFIVANRYLLSFFALGIVYLLNLRLDVMDIDAAQYASIAMEMWQSGSFLEVYHEGKDYLDKPPLLFWLSSVSMGVFGFNNWAYKLPALLVIILGIYSTYRFADMYYTRSKALMAGLILGTTQAFFLITNDVRMDGMLTGFVIFSVWQIALFLRNNSLSNLLLGSIGIAAAMLTKGPLGIVLVGFAFLGDFIIKRSWSSFFKWQWLLLLVAVAVLLIPMAYGLYHQFDLHPEKEVYGLVGPSGLKFFFWTQSFGRITGDIYWDNGAGYFYFLDTILWDFQPWVLILFIALFKKIRTLTISGFRGTSEEDWMSISCFVLGISALSLSSFKLPHYIFPLFPYAAIMVSDFIGELKPGTFARRLGRIQISLMTILHVAPFVSFLLFFKPDNLLLPAFLLSVSVFVAYLFFNSRHPQGQILWPTVVTAISFGFMLSSYFYPNLMKYQSEIEVGREVVNLPKDGFYKYNPTGTSLQFYSQRICPKLNIESSYDKGILVYTDEVGKEELIQNGDYKVLKTFDDFHISKLKIEFLMWESRQSVIEKKYLIEKIK